MNPVREGALVLVGQGVRRDQRLLRSGCLALFELGNGRLLDYRRLGLGGLKTGRALIQGILAQKGAAALGQ